MPGLFIPKISPTEPVDVRWLDAMFQQVSEALNGGLDANSLAPSYRIATSGFVENRAIFCMTGFADVNTSLVGNDLVPALGVLPIAASLVGIGWILEHDALPQTGRLIEVRIGTTVRFTVKIPRREVPVQIRVGVHSAPVIQNQIIGFAQPRYHEVFAAASSVSARIPTQNPGTTLPNGQITAFFSAVHQ